MHLWVLVDHTTCRGFSWYGVKMSNKLQEEVKSIKNPNTLKARIEKRKLNEFCARVLVFLVDDVKKMPTPDHTYVHGQNMLFPMVPSVLLSMVALITINHIFQRI